MEIKDNTPGTAHRQDALASQSSSSARRAQGSRQSALVRTTGELRPARVETLKRLATAILGFAMMLLALTLLSTATAQPATAQTTVEPGCGYYNGPPCTPVDNEYWNIYFSAPSPCDFGLIWDPASLFDPNLPQNCENASRMTLSQDTGWLGWAMNEQRYNIQARTPINLVTTLGTHNSYSSYGDGFQSVFTADQRLSIWDQLQAGARYIRLDPDYWSQNMRLCHGSSTLECELGAPPSGMALGGLLGPVGAEMGVITPGRLYAYAVFELAQWMDANPNEFIILDIHMGESACGDTITLPSGNASCSHNDLLFSPIRDYIGTSRIYTPHDFQGTVKDQLPTMQELMQFYNKRMLILSSNPLTDGNFNDVAFDRTTYYTETQSKYISSWNACHDQYDNNLWDTVNANGQLISEQTSIGKFAYASEDRTSSVGLLDPGSNYGYLNADEVTQAANCGYGIIALDFLLHQGDSQLPLLGEVPMNPDMGADHRREASIWSFDEGDTGSNGPAIMKPNGRWSSDVSTATHPFACVKGGVFDSQWVISDTKGGYYDYLNASPCPTGYVFGAPRTGPENVNLFGAHVPPGGVWLKYIGSVANLLSGVSPKSLAFAIDAGAYSAPAQQITVSGPPNTTVLVNALAPVVPILSVPSKITFDANGSATFNVSLLSSVSKLSAGFYGSTVFINAPIANTGSGPVDLIVSHASVSVILTVRGPDTVLVSASVNGSSVSEVVEGTPVHIYGEVTNVANDPNPPTGIISLRGARFDPANVIPTTTTYAQLSLLVATLNGQSYSYAGTELPSLPAGEYQLGARYPGDVFHLPAASPVINFRVRPWLNVSPQSYQLTFPQGNPGASPQHVAVNNDVNVTAAAACAPGLAGCWLQATPIAASGRQSSRQVTLAYTPFAAQLAPGAYDATVTIGDGTHTSVVVQVALTVTGTMTLNASQLNFLVARNQEAAPQEVTGQVGNVAVPLSLHASSADWLTFKNGQVLVSTHGLPNPGTYPEWIDLQEPQKGPGPVLSANIVRLPITVQVVPLSTVSTSPSETVTVDGTDYVSPVQFAWLPGSTHILSVSQIIPGADEALEFTQWSDMVASPTRQIVAPTTRQDVSSWNAIYVPDLPHFTITGRTLDTTNPEAVVFQINLSNSGPGLASQVSLTSIIPIAQTGLGFVSIAPIPPGNMSFLAPGQTGGFPLTANWPPTVNSITVQVSYSCNGGAVTGSAIVKINR